MILCSAVLAVTSSRFVRSSELTWTFGFVFVGVGITIGRPSRSRISPPPRESEERDREPSATDSTPRCRPNIARTLSSAS